VDDRAKLLDALSHLLQLRLAEFLADEVRDAILADDRRNADEHLVKDAVPAFRQRADC